MSAVLVGPAVELDLAAGMRRVVSSAAAETAPRARGVDLLDRARSVASTADTHRAGRGRETPGTRRVSDLDVRKGVEGVPEKGGLRRRECQWEKWR